jgi:hypothetical protein
MRNTLNQTLKLFFSPETIAPFLLSSICLAIFGSAIYDILKNTFGDDTPTLIRLAFISLLILSFAIAIGVWVISQRLAKIPVDIPFEVRQKQLDRQYRGLILLVSQPDTCETAIRFHLPRLNTCWLLCSTKTLELAQQVQQQFPTVCSDPPIVINDIYNPLEFCDRINEIYRHRLPVSWQETDVIADYTGMTAHASVGTVLACIGTDRPLQYTPAKRNTQGKIIGCLDPIRVLLKPESATKPLSKRSYRR